MRVEPLHPWSRSEIRKQACRHAQAGAPVLAAILDRFHRRHGIGGLAAGRIGRNDDVAAAGERAHLRLGGELEEMVQDKGLGNRFADNQCTVIAQDRDAVAAEAADQSLLHARLELEAGEFMIRDAIVEQQRLLRDRQQAARLRRNRHIGGSVGVEDGVEVRPCLHDSGMDHQRAAGERRRIAGRRRSVGPVFDEIRGRDLAEHEIGALDQQAAVLTGDARRKMIVSEIANAEMIHQPIGCSKVDAALPLGLGHGIFSDHPAPSISDDAEPLAVNIACLDRLDKCDTNEYRLARQSLARARSRVSRIGRMVMTPMTGEQVRKLLRPGRVHRDVYSDPEIFDLELDRIFGSAWIYVGHESQIKNPGDFVATRIGRKPLLLVRDAEGTIRLLHNQCAHRGSMVVASEQGHTSEFRCCYHGWTYHLNGRLKVAPLLHGYPRHFDPRNPEVAMAGVPRVASYRGFIFGSLAEDGPSLTDFLGYMTTSFDDMVDRAPEGTLELAGGVFKHSYRSNWKLYLENLCDAAHPLFVHQSSIDAAQQQSDDVHSDGAGEIAFRQMRQNGAPYSFWESKVGIWTYPNGHSFLGDYHDNSKLVAALNDPMFRDYIAALEARKGKDETRRFWRCGAGTATSIPTFPS